jgi:hypothetical protein
MMGATEGNFLGGFTPFDKRLWLVPLYLPKSSPSPLPKKNPEIRPRDSYTPAAWINDTLFTSLELQFGHLRPVTSGEWLVASDIQEVTLNSM